MKNVVGSEIDPDFKWDDRILKFQVILANDCNSNTLLDEPLIPTQGHQKHSPEFSKALFTTYSGTSKTNQAPSYWTSRS